MKATDNIDRDYYEVLPVGYGALGWKVTLNGQTEKRFLTKAKAVAWAAYTANFEWLYGSQPAELNIKGRDGKIKDKRTYGMDPEGEG